MKAVIHDVVKSLVDIRSDFSDRIIVPGTIGTIVECYDDPEAYAIDFAIPDDSLIGGFSYENVIAKRDQFEIIKKASGN